MRKQFSVKPPRSPFIADLQCGLASFFPSLNPLADCIGAHSDKRSDFITLQPFFEQQNCLLSTVIQFFRIDFSCISKFHTDNIVRLKRFYKYFCFLSIRIPCRIFFTPFLELNYYITSVLGKQVSKRNFSSPYM